MISVREYNDNDFQTLLDFCKEESKEDHPAAENMWVENWQEDCRTLPYILQFTNRFKFNNGQFYLAFDDQKLIGCSGVYKSEYTEKLCFAGTRTWLNKTYRNNQILKNEFLPIQKDWVISEHAEVIALCFNSYNSSAIRLFRIGQKTGTRSPRHLFSSNYNEVKFPVIVQFTEQWVIYENLGSYRFDWNDIKSPWFKN